MKNSTKALRDTRFFPHSLLDFAAFLLCLLFFAVRDIPILLYGGQIVAFAIILCFYARKISFKKVLPWVALIFWSFLSILWASNSSHVWKFLREITQVAMVSIAVALYCRGEKEQEKLLAYIATAGIVMICYFFLRTPLSHWREALYSTASVASTRDRFGKSIGLQTNDFGNLCALLAVTWLYQWRKHKAPLSLIWSIVLLVLLLFSKSRGSIVMFGVIVMTYWLFEKRRPRKFVFRLIFAFALVAISLWAIFNVPILYRLFGYRFAGALSLFTGEGTIDASTRGRSILIQAGLKMINDHPLLGVGAGNYSNTAFESYGIWKDVYAHNNYIELAADLGIVGLLIYYVPRFVCLFSLLRMRRNLPDEDAHLCTLLCSMAFGVLISDYFKITFSKEPQQIIFSLQYCYIISHAIRRRSSHLLLNGKERMLKA